MGHQDHLSTGSDEQMVCDQIGRSKRGKLYDYDGIGLPGNRSVGCLRISTEVMEYLQLLARGLLRRCPNCGQPNLFRHWFHMVDRCPQCGLYYEREEGYWTGAVAINTVITELVFFAMLVVIVIWTWPDVPLVPVLIAAIALNVLFPLIFYPLSKTLWVAIDLALHPLEEREEHEVMSLRNARQKANADNR
jgi:uncharacterized protein (DUF983 family)